jgi:hypothetical protein
VVRFKVAAISKSKKDVQNFQEQQTSNNLAHDFHLLGFIDSRHLGLVSVRNGAKFVSSQFSK